MIIKSNFKDYYDFVANIYGGGDPKVQYFRKPVTSDKTIVNIKITDNKTYRLLNNLYRNSNLLLDHSFKIICVHGFIFLVVKNKDLKSTHKYSVFSLENHPDLYQNLCGKVGFFVSRHKVEDFIYKEHSFATDIAKVIDQPVFSISNCFYEGKDVWKFIIEENIPILQDYGIASIIPAQTMYQELAYFITNKMRENPDILVSSTLSDKEKIASHGFDNKSSFRHRKDTSLNQVNK